MTNNLVLLTNWEMRLVVLVGSGPEVCRIIATCASLDIEVVRLFATLFNKVVTQLEIALLTRRLIEFDQRQFDLLMPAVPTPLSLFWTEDRIDIVYIAAHDV